MSYYPDLSLYTYHKSGIAHSAVNVGWLDCEFPYPQGPVQDDFLAKLWTFTRLNLIRMRGFHTCNLCSLKKPSTLSITREGETLHLGTAEIRVFGEDGMIYAAPNMIYHYIKEHSYKPPDEFINAVLNGPSPASDEYLLLLKRNNWAP